MNSITFFYFSDVENTCSFELCNAIHGRSHISPPFSRTVPFFRFPFFLLSIQCRPRISRSSRGKVHLSLLDFRSFLPKLDFWIPNWPPYKNQNFRSKSCWNPIALYGGQLGSLEVFLKVLIFVKITILTDSSHNFPKVPQVKFTFSVAEKDKNRMTCWKINSFKVWDIDTPIRRQNFPINLCMNNFLRNLLWEGKKSSFCDYLIDTTTGPRNFSETN